MGAADHLEVPRKHGLFKHHGIDLGDGTIAHYLEGREILRSTLADFCAGESCKVITHETSAAKSVTLRRAMSRIGEQSYNLLFNNCEHFANWCKTGVYRSNQIETWLHKSSLAAISIGQLLPAAFLTGLGLLLKQGLSEEITRHKAREALKVLDQLHKSLSQKLATSLAEAENYFQGTTQSKHKKKIQKLLLQGQNIADELNAVDTLKAKINDLLLQANHQN